MMGGPGVIGFVAIVGFGSTFILDLWSLLVSKVIKRPPLNWGLPGRWLVGLCKGEPVLQDKNPETTAREQALGWFFHYAVGIVYAAMLIFFWGKGYRQHPTIFPPFMIGGVLATLAGLFIMFPGLGAGICASKVPSPSKEIKLLIINHIIFALAQYGLALSMV